MSWGGLITAYQERLRVRGCALSFARQAAVSLARFQGFCEARGTFTVADVSTAVLAAYRAHLLWTPLRRGGLARPSTVAGHLGHVRSFLRWLVASGRLLVDPTRGLVLPRPPRPLLRLLTEEQVARLMEQPDLRTAQGLRDRALLELLYGLGLRREECRSLDLTDLDRVQAVVRVRWTKNRCERRLPLAPQLLAALTAYLEHGRPRLGRRHPEEPAVFLSQQGRRLGAQRLEQIVCRHSQSAGLGAVRPHALRHACATHLLARGADIRELQALLGHLHLTSTQVYTHLQPLEVFETHARTHPRA